MIEYANGLAQRDHVVTLFTPKGTVNPQLMERLHPSIELIECSVPISNSRWPLAQIRLMYAMAHELPLADIAVATHTPTTAVLFLAAWLSPRFSTYSVNCKRIRRIWLYMDYPEMFRDRYAESLLLRFMPRWFDMIWTISQPLSDYVSAQTTAPVLITGSGVPNADLLCEQSTAPPVGDKKRILYVGNSRPRKGLRDFLEAARIVNLHSCAVTIVVAGSENCLPLIEAFKIDYSSLSLDLEFHEWPSDLELARLYATADIFVSASWGEGLGYPPLEAMSCGTPVVLTDSGGTRDYARDKENCLVVEPKDVDAIAAAIDCLLFDDELAECLSRAGLETAHSYDWESPIEHIENSLDSMFPITS